MDKGQVQQFDKPVELLSNPANDFVKQLVSSLDRNDEWSRGEGI